MSLSRRTTALARTFQLVALAVGAPALALQCSSSGATTDAPDDASVPDTDATPPQGDAVGPAEDASAEAQAAVDAADAAEASQCFATVSSIDGGGPDAEELCIFAIPCGLGPAG